MNEVAEWWKRNEGRVFTLEEVFALVDQMGVSSGATREEIDHMDRTMADDPSYVWRGPHRE